MQFYVGLLPDSRILEVARYGPGEAGPEGTLKRGACELAGHRVAMSDSFVRHEFGFTPSTSLFVDCANDAEIERIATTLADGGRVSRPLADHGFSRRFAWVVDRYGVSWQIHLP